MSEQPLYCHTPHARDSLVPLLRFRLPSRLLAAVEEEVARRALGRAPLEAVTLRDRIIGVALEQWLRENDALPAELAQIAEHEAEAGTLDALPTREEAAARRAEEARRTEVEVEAIEEANAKLDSVVAKLQKKGPYKIELIDLAELDKAVRAAGLTFRDGLALARLPVSLPRVEEYARTLVALDDEETTQRERELKQQVIAAHGTPPDDIDIDDDDAGKDRDAE